MLNVVTFTVKLLLKLLSESGMKKILIIQTASIGDVILATPVVEKLHLHFPTASIDLLVKKGNESLFAGHPFVGQLLVWDKRTTKYRNLLSLLRVIQQEKYDVIVNLQRFASTGFLTVFGRPAYSTGFRKNPFSPFFSRRFPHPIDGIHEVDRNLTLLTGLVPDGTAPVKLYPQPDSWARVSQYKTRGYITVAPASLWGTKQFPAARWIEFLQQVSDILIILVGGKGDADLCNAIGDGVGTSRVLNLAGKLSLLDTAALMRDARMNYVNDSAPMHLASSVNAPVTAIYCSTVPRFGFGPRSDNSAVVESDALLPCRPCGLHGFKICPQKHFRCASTIDIQKLLNRLSHE